MSAVSLCRALALAACIAAAAPCAGTLAAPTAPPTAGLSEARALVRAGKPEQALAILRPLARGRTVHADVLFNIGIAAIVASQRPGIDGDRRDALLDEAIAALHTMLVGRPGLIRVRLELARAFFLKGEDRLARRHFEQVLAGNPPAGVALNVNRFLNIMRARKRWSLRVGMALAPDTNIGAGSEERIIFIPVGGVPLPFRRNEEELTTSGIGVSAWLGGEYQYPLADRWRLRAGGDVRRREYKGSDFDQTTLAAHLGPRWLIGRGSDASLLLSGLHVWTGAGLEEPSHHDIGFRVEGRHRLGPRTTVNARASWHRRAYDREDNRDGPLIDVSLGTGWVAAPTLRLDASVGWARERPEAERWRNSSRRAQVGATAALPWGFTLGGSGALRWTEWDGNWFPFVEGGGERKDLTRTIRLFAHNRALTVEGFSPQVSVTQETRTTNAQAHDYERVSGELRFVRLF